ncbi:MAG: hypothetical protein LLG40_14000 [Deltaproteobacteria bacterium]|nr:hypothetical protein [Deltaproteobacteria bacterium]
MAKAFSMSLDQIEYEEYQKQVKVVGPLEYMTASMEACLHKIYETIGIDCSVPIEEIQTQLKEKGVLTQYRFEEKLRAANGLYVLQGKAIKDIDGDFILDTSTIEPVGFISEPKKHKNGQAYITIESYLKGVQFEMPIMKLQV